MNATDNARGGGKASRPAPAVWWIGLLLVAAVAAAWANSLHGAFILDDKPAIVTNPSIRHVWPLTAVLRPPNNGETVTGRPLLNLSFALNWAASGKAVWSYHATNALIHALAALLLFGVVRRTLVQPLLAPRFGRDARWIAGAAALVWAVHPLLTEAVTYIAQRAESFAALCYLGVLYGFIRAMAQSERRRTWLVVSVAACVAGGAVKETIVSAPLLVLLYDRTFVAGGFRAALRQRARYYAALLAALLLLAGLALQAGNRGRTAGFGLEIGSWPYLLTQCRALGRYAVLSLWPARLTLDYGFGTVTSLGAVAGRGLAIGGLFGATLLAVRGKRPIGVAALAFFALLAPSSSFIPVVTQTIAEHRMYLPLAVVVLAAVAVAYVAAGRRALAAAAVAGLALMALTAHRNRDYRSAIGMWHDTIAKAPQNPRAYLELGTSLIEAGRAAEAIPVIETTLRLRPDTPKAECNLGVALTVVGRFDEALRHFRIAAAGLPENPEPVTGAAYDLMRLGRPLESVAWCQRAVQLKPNDAEAHKNLAIAYEKTARLDESVQEFEAAIRCDPRDANVRLSYGNVLSEMGRRVAAIAQFRAALAVDASLVDAHLNLGALLINAGELDDGIRETKIALQLDPNNRPARENLQRAQAQRARPR